MNTKQAMQQAKKHIQAKEYDEARAVLSEIDHPMAREWEQKLPKAAKSSQNSAIYIGAVAVITLIIGTTIGFFIGRTTAPQASVASLPTEVLPATEVETSQETSRPTLPPTWTPQNNSSASEQTSSSRWFTAEQTSSIDNSQMTIIYVSAQNPVQNQFDESTPSLVVGCNRGQWNVFIDAGSQVESLLPNDDDEVFVMVSYDIFNSETQYAEKSVTGNIFFLQDPEQEIRQMLNANTMAVNYIPLNANVVGPIFNLDGLRDALQPLEQNCPTL